MEITDDKVIDLVHLSKDVMGKLHSQGDLICQLMLAIERPFGLASEIATLKDSILRNRQDHLYQEGILTGKLEDAEKTLADTNARIVSAKVEIERLNRVYIESLKEFLKSLPGA